MEPVTAPPAKWKTLLAFAIIYFVWGSTFLAIRIGVHEIPPLLCAAMRFLAAGSFLVIVMKVKGESLPTARQLLSALTVAFLIFVVDYGLVFWAEQRVPSGVTAVMLAAIPLFMALAEILILRTQRLTLRLAIALLVGISGVAVLVSRSLNLSGAPIEPAGAIALIVAAMSFSLGSILSRKLILPASKIMSAGVQMLVGGVLLAIVSTALGEYRGFHPVAVSAAAWIALLYLIVPGSIIGFSAYVWLLHHQSPTKVGTYAYVNPVVAVLLGYFLANEALGMRTIVGALFVLVSVLLITTAKKPA
jgi:drug/metabolite transporter (DMT)-like permease